MNELERAERVRQVLDAHPGLPVLVLAPATPCDYSTYYHEVMGAGVCRLLFPSEVERLYGDSYGLNVEKTYDDVDEVEEDVYDWLWENVDNPFVGGLTAYGLPWRDVYGPVARMMAEDMPWRDYVVIDCY